MKTSIIVGVVISACMCTTSLYADELNGFGSNAVTTFAGTDTLNNIFVAYQDSSTGDLRVSVNQTNGLGMLCQGTLGQPTRSGSTLGINGRPSATGHVIVVPVYNFGTTRTEIWSRVYTGSNTSDACSAAHWSSWTQLPDPTDWVNTAPSIGQVGTSGYYAVVGAIVGSTNGLNMIHSSTGTSWSGSWTELPALPSGESVASAAAVEQYNGYLWVAIVSQDSFDRYIRYIRYNPSTSTWSDPDTGTTNSWSTSLGYGYCAVTGGSSVCHSPLSAPTLATNSSEGVIWIGYTGNHNHFYSTNYLSGYNPPWLAWFDSTIDGFSSSSHSAPSFGFVGTWYGNGLIALALKTGSATVEEAIWDESTYAWSSFFPWSTDLTE